jgi:hypothetical protein
METMKVSLRWNDRPTQTIVLCGFEASCRFDRDGPESLPAMVAVPAHSPCLCG